MLSQQLCAPLSCVEDNVMYIQCCSIAGNCQQWCKYELITVDYYTTIDLYLKACLAFSRALSDSASTESARLLRWSHDFTTLSVSL